MNRCRFPGNRLRALPTEKLNKATSGVFQRDIWKSRKPWQCSRAPILSAVLKCPFKISKRVREGVPVHLLHWTYLGVTGLLSRWATWTSADQTRSLAESHPWPDTGRQPGCVCTGRKERRHRFITWTPAPMWLMTRIWSPNDTPVISIQRSHVYTRPERSSLALTCWEFPAE